MRVTPAYYLLPGAVSAALALLTAWDPLAMAIPLAASILVFVSSGGSTEGFASSPLGAPFRDRALGMARSLMRRAMAFGSSAELGAQMTLSIGALPPILMASALAAVASRSPLPLAGAALAAVPLFQVLRLRSSASSRKEWTESELPFFATIAVALVSSGLSFYYVLKRVSELPHLFRQIRREALLVVRNVEVVGMGVLEAMDEVARDHPSDLFRSLIYTVTGVSRTGGSVTRALEERGKEALLSMRRRWEAFASRMRTLGEMSIIVFMILPLSLAVAGIAFASVAYQGMLLVNLLALPVLGFMFNIIVLSSVPRALDVYTPPRYLPALFVLGPAAGVLTYLVAGAAGLQRSLVLAFSVAVGVASMAVYLVMRGQLEEVRSSNEQTPRLLREVIEARKSGMDYYEAVRTAALSGRYGGAFGRVLKKIAARMTMFPPSESASTARSWATRMCFFMLDEVERSGGGSPVLLEGVVETLSAYHISRKEGAASARLYLFLAFAFPLLTLFATSMILSIAGQLQSFAEAQQQLRFATPAEMEQVVEMAWLSVGEAGVMMLLAVSRAMDLCYYGLWRIAVFSVLLALAAMLQPATMHLMVGFFIQPPSAG